MSHMVRAFLERGAVVLCPIEGAPMTVTSPRTGRVGHLNQSMNEHHVFCAKDVHDEQCECPLKEETND